MRPLVTSPLGIVCLAGGVLGLVGCLPPPVYRVQRTARVPRPAAPLRTGEPLAGPIEVSVGASSIGDLQRPRLTDTTASLEVPSEQVRGELRIRIRERGEITGIYERALSSGMIALDPTQAKVEQGAPTGVGLAGRYSIETGDPAFSIGVGLEALALWIPNVEIRTCVENCSIYGEGIADLHYGYETAESLALSVTPTYRSGAIALFATAYARRHPTIERKGTELYAGDHDEDVSSGNYGLLLAAGLEYRLPVVSLLATVQQPMTTDPVQYGPSFGLAIALRGEDRPRQPPPPPPPQLPSDPW